MNKTVGKIGIALLLVGIILIFINDLIDNDFLKNLAEYKKFFWIFGGAFIGVGFLGKKKVDKS